MAEMSEEGFTARMQCQIALMWCCHHVVKGGITLKVL